MSKNNTSKKPRFITEYGLEGKQEHAVNGGNTIEDLNRYLYDDPHPEYRLVSANLIDNNWHLVWELKGKAS